MVLLIAAASADEGLPPLMTVHVDPSASLAPSGWSGELGARVEFPLLVGGIFVALEMVDVVTGQPEAVDRVLTPLPPLSAMYTGYVARRFSDGRWSGGGGLALRYRPLQTTQLPAVARGVWIDVGGRYGTRGWGFESGIGWDLSATRNVAIGPAVGFAWEGGEARVLATVSFSFSLFVEDVAVGKGDDAM